MNVRSIASIAFVLSIYTSFSQTLQHVTYESSSANFPNPERGLYHHKEVRSSAYVNLQRDELLRYRDEGVTLIMRVFYLESFVNSDISAEYLDHMRHDFSLARETGMKLLVRFAYTQKTTKPIGDAQPAWVLAHIAQLKDILMQNSDVIALVQAGFIGAWGEWFYTDYFSQVIGYINEQNWLDRAAVVNALLGAIPTDRTVQLRTPAYKRKLSGTTEPLYDADGFTGTVKARLGHHNDCFLASSNDIGTYVNVEEEKNYIAQDTHFVPLGGETCGVDVPRSQCPSALAEMARLHWSYLNEDYHPLVVKGFEDGGCLPDIRTKLGYRFRLIDGDYQTATKPSGELKVKLNITNEGWANPYNPRYLEFVLRNEASGKEYFLRATDDPRRWSPNDTITIEETFGLPASIEEGSYSLHLSLPDPRIPLYNNPGYAIHLANEQVWDDVTGYNALNVTVNVGNTNVVNTYAGSDYFEARNKIDLSLDPSPVFSSSASSEVMLYWGLSQDDGYRVIQRSTNGGSFETIATLDGSQASFKDEAVDAGTSYQYRYYFKNDNKISTFTDAATTETKLQDADFETFTPDGTFGEWDVVAPVATRYFNGTTYALRLFADRNKLNVLIDGAVDKNYVVYLNTDEREDTGISDATWLTSGFDYCVRRDSLFQAQNGQWQFLEKVVSVLGGDGLEVSVSLENFDNLEDNLRIKTAAKLKVTGNTSVQLPFSAQPSATYIRTTPASTPTAFAVTNSEAMPQSRLVVQWTNDCLSCKGVVLERSDNSTSGFSEIFRTTSASIYRDDNLAVNKTYYYRIYTFNETGKSPFAVANGTTHNVVTAIEDPEHGIKVYPVPVENTVVIQAIEPIWSVTVHDALGHATQIKEIDRQQDQIKLDLSALPSGVYILWIHLGDRHVPRKILKH